MKKVIFKTLKVRNFLSIGKTPVVINFQKGLNIITGINRDLMDRQNGVGKSTVVDAFYFTLFGETTRELKKEFISNNVTNDTTEVSLQFAIDEKQYELIRTIKPSKCQLFEDGNDISRDSMGNTTEHVLQLLNLTPEIFSNCICLSINSTVPFMAQKKIDKRKFIEGIFNLDIFSKMNSSLKEEYNSTKKDIELVYTKYTELGNSIKVINAQNERILTDRKNREKTIQSNIDSLKSQIDTLETQIQSYVISDSKDMEAKIAKLEDKKMLALEKAQEFASEVTKYDTENRILKDNFSKIGTDKDECPICLRPIKDDDHSHIEDKKSEIINRINDNNAKKESHQLDLKRIKDEVALIDKGIAVLRTTVNTNNLQAQKLQSDKDKLDIVNRQLAKEEKALEDLNTASVAESKSTEDLQKKLEEYKTDLDDKKKFFGILDKVKFVLSEEGVKSYVVKKILNLFNSKIAFYLKELNANALIKFDQYFDEEITNERGKPTMYFNYSGAERKAIDLAVMFAFIDMLKMQTNVYYNVQFYDELLDTSLDSTGVENVVRILNDFVDKYSYGIYVISHRKECSKLANGEVVYLEKSNGITKRISAE